jgi:hypothetical protein
LEIAVDQAVRKLLMEGMIEARHVKPDPRSTWLAPVRNFFFVLKGRVFPGREDDGAFLRRAGIKLKDR